MHIYISILPWQGGALNTHKAASHAQLVVIESQVCLSIEKREPKMKKLRQNYFEHGHERGGKLSLFDCRCFWGLYVL